LVESAAWLDLPQRGKVAVRGPDRTRLVHALTTNDIRSLLPGAGCYSFLLNAQGRVIADANVFCLPEQILLDTEPEARSAVLTQLEQFTIADDAVTTDLSDVLMTVSVEGPEAARVLEAVVATLPAGSHQISEAPFGWVAHVTTTGQPGWMLFVPPVAIAPLVRSIEEAGAVRASAEDARVVRIENGRPRFGEEITERFLAPETGQFDAISRQKGCYLGQEVVERLRSRNAVSRILTPIRFDSGSSAIPGTKLRAGDVRAGEIGSAVYSPRFGQWVGMAYIRTDVVRPGARLSFDSGSLTIVDAPGTLDGHCSVASV
jgi:folate-binding protein YgfZ